jgi:aspartyl-tRNA(Asn)/glutamyl-tRNA(Gln) amidotransferase subunit A
LVRSVQDAALVLQAIAGHDVHDSSSLAQPVGDYNLAVQQADTPPRLGVLRDFFRDHADAETQQHTEATVERLARAGASVREVSYPELYHRAGSPRMIMKVEAAALR